MGDAADDAWASAFEQDADEKAAVAAIRAECRFGRSCTSAVFYNDDGLFECEECGRMTDV